MAFPVAPYDWNPQVEISDKEYKLFHYIDRQLMNILIHTLGRNSFDAISVVAFLLWLERSRHGVKAVEKVVTQNWPNHLVDMLADQVVALLKWLKNPTLVWEMCGYVSLIQELCTLEVGFVYLHERRLEILKENTEIVNDMAAKAFKDMFPNRVMDKSVQDGVGQRYVRDPRELINMNHYVARYGSTDGGLVHGRLIRDSRQLENRNIGIGFSIPVVPIRNPQGVQANIHNGVGYQADQRLIYDPRRLNSINHNGLGYGRVNRRVRVHPEPEIMNGAGAGGFGTVGEIFLIHPGRLGNGMERGLVQFHREPENMNGDGSGGFGTVGGLVQVHGKPGNPNEDGFNGGYDDEPISDDGQILPNVPFGPRLGYVDVGNPGTSRRSEMMNTRRAFSEGELAVLLSGLNIRDEDTDVHDDDKTIFLTFSRGYPITEPEIWSFFTRRFGNFIKAIHLEEVHERVQPLYARMVARNSSILPLICDVNVRTKYVINGKHVWAKKYVRKHHTPPPRLSSSTVDPPPSP